MSPPIIIDPGPGTPVTPPDPGDAPIGVINAGNIPVWNYQYSGVGRSEPTTKKVGVDSLPSGAAIVDLGGSQLMLKFTNATSLDFLNWDTKGYGIWVAGAGALRLSQCDLFGYPGFNTAGYIFRTEGGVNFVIEDCSGDGLGTTGEGMTINAVSAIIRRSSLKNFGTNFIKSFVGTGLVQDTYIGACMLAAAPGYHGEIMHCGGPSTLTKQRVMIDQRGGIGIVVQGPNGNEFAECDFGPGNIVSNWYNCVTIGLAAIGGNLTVTRDSAGMTLATTMQNNSFEAGTSGYAGGTATSATLSGNLDIHTAVNVDSQLVG